MAMRTLWLFAFVVGCGARETYVPQPPNPQDFGVTGVLATADTSDSAAGATDTAAAPDTGTADTGGFR